MLHSWVRTARRLSCLETGAEIAVEPQIGTDTEFYVWQRHPQLGTAKVLKVGKLEACMELLADVTLKVQALWTKD